jgi:hypothetical protein
MTTSSERKRWEPEVVDHRVVMSETPLTDAERIDRLEQIVHELSMDLVVHGGSVVRGRAAIIHLTTERGWRNA